MYVVPPQAALYTPEYALLHYACVSLTYSNKMKIHDSLKKLPIPGINKKHSWCWQTRATRLEASQGHQTWYILYVRYGFLLMCYSKSVRRTVFEIFNFKNAVILKTELGVRPGHWKFHHSVERVWLPIDVL